MYRWVDHTAELELEIEAASEQQVLEDALRALADLLGPLQNSGEERRTVTVSASDRPALLAGWLEELVFLAESEGFIGAYIEQLDLSEDSLRGAVVGRLGEPSPLVKAVTYHRLEFSPTERGYFARVVLDV